MVGSGSKALSAASVAGEAGRVRRGELGRPGQQEKCCTVLLLNMVLQEVKLENSGKLRLNVTMKAEIIIIDNHRFCFQHLETCRW